MRRTIQEGRGIPEDIWQLYARIAGAEQKYPGELHVKDFSYLGPGTRLDIRLDENDRPKAGEEPINDLDRVAMNHDIAYRQAGKEFDTTKNKPGFNKLIRKADNEFITKAKQSRDAPATGFITSDIMLKKQQLETLGLLPTRIFSGRGIPKYVKLALQKK
jgi:hypothetical protein